MYHDYGSHVDVSMRPSSALSHDFTGFVKQSDSHKFSGADVTKRHLDTHRPSSRSGIQTLIMDYIGNPFGGRDPDGFVRRSRDEDCIKCMLRIPHQKCQSHKYIRVGGGYRQSYWYIKMILAEIQFQRDQELLRQRHLEAIAEGRMRAVKTYIRTKSGRLIERIVFLNDEDYQAFKDALARGDDPSSILRKYLDKDEAKNLEAFDKEEMKAIKTMIRTKSGRLIEQIVYVTKEEFDAIQRGDVDANEILKRHLKLKDGQKIEGWEAPRMRTITTKIRTKSGRIIEKVLMVSEEDYQKMMKGGGNMNEILKKYMNLEDGATVEGISKVDKPKQAMKVIKTYIRTKSGRLIEKEVIMTEEEYAEFMKSGGNPDILKKYIKLKEGETMEGWEKASTIYADSDDEDMEKAKAGDKIVDKDGNVYEVYVDPLTGKKYKKLLGNVSDPDNIKGGVIIGKDGKPITKEDILKRERAKQGKRNADSDSEYSYHSYISAGGTRHVRRKKKNPDGTYAKSESYHSSQDEDGEARRRRRRRDRKHGSGSEHSYYSVVSAGGTRHVKRKKRLADGTYGDSESYHSEDSALYKAAKQAVAKQEAREKLRRREAEGDSDHSYFSEVSEGGTRHQKKRKRIRDDMGNIVGYGKSEPVVDPDAGKKKERKKNPKHGSDSEHSYFSEISEGGTKHQKKRKRIRDKDGNIVGYGDVMDHDSDEERRRKRREKHGEDSEYSYFSEVSAGGTRTTKRTKRIRDKDGNVIGHGAVEDYESEPSVISVSDGKGGRMKVANPNKLKTKPKQQQPGTKQLTGKEDGFSDATTDSDVVAEKLKNMTEEEKAAYLTEREKRKQEREEKRREKYGDKYDEIMASHQKKKEAVKEEKRIEEIKQKKERERIADKQKQLQERMQKQKELKEQREKEKHMKTSVDYGKGPPRFKEEPTDERDYPPGDASKTKDKKKGKDGNEADSESEYTVDETGKRVKKDKKKRSDSGSSYEVVRDKDGNIIKKIKKDKDGNLIEYEYDDKGNIIGKKNLGKDGKGGKGSGKPMDNEFFEVGEDGKIRLKAGKKKIDIDKLSKEDLRKMGIDPNLSKAEIMKLLKEKFGDDLEVTFKGGKIGSKPIGAYSNANTDDLANDSDLDLDTLRGMKRIRVLMKKGGQALLDHMKNMIELSKLGEPMADERDAKIDFLSAYRLVDPDKLELYAKAFVCEDLDDMDGVITYKNSRIALHGVPTVGHITSKQMDYVMKALDIDENSAVTFRMFSVIIALCERVTKMDQFCRDLLEISNLIDIERKLALYRAMFYCNATSERDTNFIKLESLKIELMAGGLNWSQQQFILSKIPPNEFFEISFLDFLCYIPLFLSFHDNICHNPLDMSLNKYQPEVRRKASVQRDMNPLGYHLNKESPYVKKTDALIELHLEAKHKVPQQHPVDSDNDDIHGYRADNDILNRYTKLPNIGGSSYPTTPKHGRRASHLSQTK